MRRLRAWLLPRDDRGFSLMEVMAATVVMSVVVAITTAAILEIYRSVGRIDAETEAQTQVAAAFKQLDKEIRYARGISLQSAPLNGDYYVEYLVNLNSVDTCVQLRLRPGTSELQRRQWVKNVEPLAPTTWTTLAALTTSTTPFTVTSPEPNTLTGWRYQRLRVTFTATVGVGNAQSKRVSDVTFTALNATSGQDLTSTTCIEARGVDS